MLLPVQRAGSPAGGGRGRGAGVACLGRAGQGRKARGGTGTAPALAPAKHVGRVPAGWAHPDLPLSPTWRCWSACLPVGSDSEHARFLGGVTAGRMLPDFARTSPGCGAVLEVLEGSRSDHLALPGGKTEAKMPGLSLPHLQPPVLGPVSLTLKCPAAPLPPPPSNRPGGLSSEGGNRPGHPAARGPGLPSRAPALSPVMAGQAEGVGVIKGQR